MKKSKNAKKTIRNVAIAFVSVAIVLVVLYGIGYSTGFVQRAIPALKVGDHKINALEYRFYYTDAKQNLIDEYGDAMKENGVDFNKPLESQNYTEDQSWAEYIHNMAVQNLTEIYGVYDAALKDGYVMDEETEVSLNSYIDSIVSSSEESGTTADDFIHSIYGKYIGLDELKEFLHRKYYAIGYLNAKENEYIPTEEEIETQYENNKNDYEVVYYNLFFFNWETDEESGEPIEESKAEAKALADEMCAKVTDAQSFGQLAYEYCAEDKKGYYQDLDVTYVDGAIIRSDSGAIGEWYGDISRQHGDKAVIESNNGYAVVLYDRRELLDYNTVSVRHILVPVATAEDPEDEEEVKKNLEEAKATAEELLETFKSGEATEDSFAKLADEHTYDLGSLGTGGLYEEFGKDTMAEQFEDWSFNENNKPGDTGIIQTENGFHVMYFVSTGRPYWIVKAEDDLQEDYFNDLYAEATENIETTRYSYGMSMAF